MFTNFYMWSKKEIDLYPTLKSKDKMNREKYKDDIKIPKLRLRIDQVSDDIRTPGGSPRVIHYNVHLNKMQILMVGQVMEQLHFIFLHKKVTYLLLNFY